MKWFFHIGPNKTGTTTIQFALHQARRSLIERGVLYPKQGIVNSAHHMLNFSLNVALNGRAPYAEALGIKNIPTFDQLVGDMRREAQKSGVDQIIVSSEILWSWNLKKIRYLKDTLNDDEVAIVLATRPHLERELSMWQEEVKHGFIGSPPSYLELYGDTAKSKGGFVLTERVARWKDVGFDILPIPFPARSTTVPIWDTFLIAVVGAEIGQMPVPDSLNVSLDYLTTLTIRDTLVFAADLGILGSLPAENNKIRPLNAAFAIRDTVQALTNGIDRVALPAYGEFLLDAGAELRAISYSGRYLMDLASVLEIVGARMDVNRLVDCFDPLRLFQSPTDDQREEYFRQSELAQDLAQQAIRCIQSPSLENEIRKTGIKLKSGVRKLLSR